MNTKLLGVIACMAALGGSPATATTYYAYSVSDTAGLLSVNGSITTNSDSGILHAANIKSWSLTVSGYGPPLTIPFSLSNLILGGNDLTATATQLLFNYGDTTPAPHAGVLSFQGPAIPYAYATWAAAGHEAPGLYLAEVQTSSSDLGGYSDRSGDLVIATGGEVVSPLPAALPLFASGLGVLGLFGWRTKRKNA
jgi:hypothetical protein